METESGRSATQEQQALRHYWSKNIVIPATGMAMAVVGIAFGLVAFNLHLSEQRQTTNSLRTLSLLVADPILLGDHLGSSKRIAAIGNLQRLVVVVRDIEGRPLASFPERGSSVEPARLPLCFDIVSVDGRKLGELSGYSDTPFVGYDLRVILIVVALILGSLVFLVIRAIRPIITDIVSLSSFGGDSLLGSGTRSFRFAETQETFMLLQKQAELVLSHEKERVALDVAAQVAHDIRSPLAALDSVVNRLGQLPEQERVFMRNAINRIKDIANNLLQKNREMGAKSATQNPSSLTATVTAETSATLLLSSLIDPLISEKRMQYRSTLGITIDGRLDATCYGLFASIQPTEFKRVLSNLINNSVEVLGERGTVTVEMTQREDKVEIAITTMAQASA